MTTKVTSREYLWLTVYSTLHDLHLYLSVVFLVVRSVAKYLGNPGRYSEASGFVARGGSGLLQAMLLIVFEAETNIAGDCRP